MNEYEFILVLVFFLGFFVLAVSLIYYILKTTEDHYLESGWVKTKSGSWLYISRTVKI
jgi:hypothetical protein